MPRKVKVPITILVVSTVHSALSTASGIFFYLRYKYDGNIRMKDLAKLNSKMSTPPWGKVSTLFASVD